MLVFVYNRCSSTEHTQSEMQMDICNCLNTHLCDSFQPVFLRKSIHCINITYRIIVYVFCGIQAGMNGRGVSIDAYICTLQVYILQIYLRPISVRSSCIMEQASFSFLYNGNLNTGQLFFHNLGNAECRLCPLSLVLIL